MTQRYGDFAAAGSTEPSFGLVSMGTVAEKASHDIKLIDAAAQNLSVEDTHNAVIAHSPEVTGISSTTMGINAAYRLARRLKSSSPDMLIVLGGCHASALPEETLHSLPAIDLLVVGEGEQTFAAILNKLDRSGSIPKEVKGTVYRENDNTISRAPRRKLIDPLDSLPLPDWSLLNGFPENFHPSPARIRRWPCASVVLTRGCPNQCTFCDRSVFGNVCRAYSPEYALEMLRDLSVNYGVREILIEDDTFVIRKEHVRRFCELLIRENLNLSWSCLGRVDRMDKDILALMHKAGCWHISYGIESGSPEILQRVKKNIDLDTVNSTLSATRAAGIETKGFFILGLPGETPETIEQTRQLVRKIPSDDITVMKFTPFPGSEEYRRLQQAGQTDLQWEQMNTLNTACVPADMTSADLDRAHSEILRTFYSRPDIVLRHGLKALRRPRTIPHLLKGLNVLRKVTR